MDKDELLACPFCGAEAFVEEQDGRFYVACYNLKCFAKLGEGVDGYGSPDHRFGTEADAIAAWNTRASLRSKVGGE